MKNASPFVECYFFFQAEDGIRDKLVTGVQTCALPISYLFPIFLVPLWLGFYGTKGAVRCLAGIVGAGVVMALLFGFSDTTRDFVDAWAASRSEERRVGKEGRSPWSPSQLNNTRVWQWE